MIYLQIENTDTRIATTSMQGWKNKFSGMQKSVLLKAGSRECFVPHNFLLFVTVQGTHVCLIVYLVVHQIK